MIQQITVEQAQIGFDNYIEKMSMTSKIVMIKIGAEWSEVVGASGSWVSKTMLMKALEQERPWTANKLTQNGNGRNGIVYSLIPMLKSHHLVIVNSVGTHTKYMLTDTGKEVLQAMVYSCAQCNTTRVCRCEDGYEHYRGELEKCKHTLRQDCGTCEGSGFRNGMDSSRCWNCVEHCENCDDENNRFCYSCKGTSVCKSCKDPSS